METKEDLRAAQREKCMRTGIIVHRLGHCVSDCIVYDLSAAGARIRPHDTSSLPDAFTLQLNDGQSYDCSIEWRSADVVGVSFTQPVAR